ncbi:MAG: 3-hydroxyacyl-CoA dehydrogenase NAD-binding domain-containing protein [Leptospiraceae bacterium]|nr:3-hydroxyacyl-CoA dehydrogenase NAD-binding domain-containing protein [Leptospiraceae bacterium]MDW8305491.1 3-hydroxyacyl-CoA dehydrogenase NAD-binding domain-containing protein [Leptospiraceae bacterium]
MLSIRKIAVLGANGTMGSLCGGLFAQAGVTCYFFARDLEKANAGIKAAISQARSEVLRNHLVPKTYEELAAILPECDWILEALPDDLLIKREYLNRVNELRHSQSIVSTITRFLSIHKIAEGFPENFQQHFLGTLFYNPPSRFRALELIFHEKFSQEKRSYILHFCEKNLLCAPLVSYDRPGFTGYRIVFPLLNGAAQWAQKHGAAKIDYLLGGYTGRALPPLAMIDAFGVDTYITMMETISQAPKDENPDLRKPPDYLIAMRNEGLLGQKTKGGFFRRDSEKNLLELDPHTLKYVGTSSYRLEWVEKAKEHIHNGLYHKAMEILTTAEGEEAELVRRFLLGYISYAFHRIGEVTSKEDFIHSIDRAMSYGFAWLPPSGWVDLLGGAKKTVALMEKAGLPIPESLKNSPEGRLCRIREVTRFLVVD